MPAPAGIVSDEAGMKTPLAEVVLRLTVSGPLASTGFPKASSRATMIVPPAMPAVRVCGAVVNASWLAAAGLTVSCCVAEVRRARPGRAAVSVGVPADVSSYWKLTVLAPAARVSGEPGVNVPSPDDVPRITVSALAGVDQIAEGVFLGNRDRAGGDARGEGLRQGCERQMAGRGRVDGLVLRGGGQAAGGGRERRKSRRRIGVLEADGAAPAAIVNGEAGLNAPLSGCRAQVHGQ